PQISIKIDDRQAVFDIKSFLSQKVAPSEISDKISKVFLLVPKSPQSSESIKIELPLNYLLDEIDVKKIEAVEGVNSLIFS
ncbi:MAG: hypothetical protein O3B09_01540, partial [Proteobacteria bacterium]|nr:hypothetical protein [Pseudomonadota bacterium]